MDPWQSAVANYGADFEAFMDLNASVTVLQIDPDAGTATATSASIPALKMQRTRQRADLGGGELAQDACQFVFRLSSAGFTPKARDQVIDATGITWVMTRVELIGFNQLCVADVEVKR